MACNTNTSRSHWFATTGLGAYGATIGDGINASAYSSLFRQVSNALAWTPVYSEDEGSNGTPWVDADGVALDTEGGSGSVILEPRADDFRAIVPLLLGAAFVTDVCEPPVAGYCDYFKAGRGLGIVQKDFMNCRTSQWTLSASSSQPKLRLDWGIESIGINRTGDGSVPAGPSYSTLGKFVHTSSVITIDGNATPVDDVQITGNNNVTPLRYNTTNPTDLISGKQVFSFTATSPFDGANDIAWFDLGVTSVVASFVYTSGNMSLTIDFPAVQPVVPTPQSPAGEAPTRHEGIVWTARAPSAGTAPIKFTLDDTP